MLRDLTRQFIFPGSPTAFPTAETLSQRYPGATLLPIRTSDGLALTAARVPSREKKKGARTIVFFHGNGESAAENLDFAAELAARGFDVVLAEYRGYGRQPGAPSEEGVYADARGVLDAIAVPKEKLVLVGRSLGTGVAVEMAAAGFGAALVLISPFTSIPEVAARFLGPIAAVAITDRFDSASKIARVKIPIVVLHGTNDEIVPFALGKRLAEMAGATFFPIPGRGHNDLYEIADQVADALGLAS